MIRIKMRIDEAIQTAHTTMKEKKDAISLKLTTIDELIIINIVLAIIVNLLSSGVESASKSVWKWIRHRSSPITKTEKKLLIQNIIGELSTQKHFVTKERIEIVREHIKIQLKDEEGIPEELADKVFSDVFQVLKKE